MRTKAEIQKELKSIESKIENLENKRDNLLSEISSTGLTRAEKLENVLKYGKEDESYCIDSDSFIIENYLDNRSRHQTIYIEKLIEYALENYMCDTYEDQKEIEKILNSDYEIDETEYNDFVENVYVNVISKSEFEQFVDEIIEANCKSFKYDW